MKKTMIAALAATPAVVFAGLYGDTPDATHAWAVHDWNRPKPAKVSVDRAGVPSDALVLFDGTKESFEKNWRNDKGGVSGWSLSPEGYFYCKPYWTNGGGIFTRREFGDCQLHVEYRHDPAQIFTDKGPQMRGNSGVFLMGPDYGYEVQVLESYFTSRELEGKEGYVDNYADGQAGSVYAENPPMVNPANKPGEWQVYDIVFHQPVWAGDRMVHPGSLTVFFNGVLVQDHWEIEGETTHCRRRPCKPHPTKGPLHFQDHGCEVQYRNIWIREIPSRWDNLTHSNMSAEPAKVMELRRETAKRLYGAIKAEVGTPERAAALAEVVSYDKDGYYAEFTKALDAYRAKKDNEWWNGELNRLLDILIRNKVVGEELKIK